MISTSQILHGSDIKINDNITVKNHTLKDIMNFGDKEYFSAVNVFAMRPYDYRIQLYDVGIDYRDLTDFQMCLYLYKSNIEAIKFILGDYNFQILRKDVTNEFVLVDTEKMVEIDEATYSIISYYIKTINCIELEKVRIPANDYAYKDLMKEESKRQKRLAQKKTKQLIDDDSYLRKYISALAWGNKVGINILNIWELNIYQFFDGIKTVSNQKESDDLRRAIYAGTIDVNKIDKSLLNWVR